MEKTNTNIHRLVLEFIRENEVANYSLNQFDYGMKLLEKYAKMRRRQLISKREYNEYRKVIEKEFLGI